MGLTWKAGVSAVVIGISGKTAAAASAHFQHQARLRMFLRNPTRMGFNLMITITMWRSTAESFNFSKIKAVSGWGIGYGDVHSK